MPTRRIHADCRMLDARHADLAELDLAQHWIGWRHWRDCGAGADGCGVWWLMPRAARLPKSSACCWRSAVGCLASIGCTRRRPAGETILFSRFRRGGDRLCAMLMITNRNPVYSALWFALATLSVCGLFLLQSAPFLAAATVIVYAGAIIVTFMFVIMLAQQSGRDGVRSAVAAAVAGDAWRRSLLLGALLGTLRSRRTRTTCDAPTAAIAGRGRANPLSQPADGPSRSARCTAWAGRCSAIICSRSSWPARCCWSPRSARSRSRRADAEGTL